MVTNQKAEWCYNTLTVSCGASSDNQFELDSFISTIIDNEDKSALSFNKLIRIPKILIENWGHTSDTVKNRNFELCGYESLKEFTLENWGCEYDPVNTIHTKLDDVVHQYEFQTRGLPPEVWIAEVSQLYPNLEFELEATNELDLWEDFCCSYKGGTQLYHQHKKNQPK